MVAGDAEHPSAHVDPSAPELVAGDQLSGARIVRLRPHADERGSFTEVFCDHWDAGIDPTQWSLVTSELGVLRGMHVHLRHDEYFMTLQGHVSIGLHDLRPDSPTAGRWARYELAAPDCFLSFPRGIVHGWLFHAPTIHLQAVSESYVDYGRDDNHGCHWSDPALGIEWPFEPTVLSGRASDFPALDELRTTLWGES